MNEKFAVDTNILLYALDDFDSVKQHISQNILSDSPVFCSQSLSELINVCLRRWKLPKSRVGDIIEIYIEQCFYVPVTKVMVLKANDIVKRYDFQIFDAIIVASALEIGCSILYSEDMANGQLIDGKLEIVNPFLT